MNATSAFVQMVDQYRGDAKGLENALRNTIFSTNINENAANPAPVTTTFDDAIHSTQDLLDKRNIPVKLPNESTIKQKATDIKDKLVNEKEITLGAIK